MFSLFSLYPSRVGEPQCLNNSNDPKSDGTVFQITFFMSCALLYLPYTYLIFLTVNVYLYDYTLKSYDDFNFYFYIFFTLIVCLGSPLM